MKLLGVKTPEPVRKPRAICRLCGEKTTNPERLQLIWKEDGIHIPIAFVHEKCLKNAYKIMILNNL